MRNKIKQLKEKIESYESLAVAFSGGVDSTFLLDLSHQLLGDRVVAITAVADPFPLEEMKAAEDFCKENKIRQIKVDVSWEELKAFADNTPRRCYICKNIIFGKIQNIAKENGLNVVADGSNKDDEDDYRPGMQALKELGIQSPLREEGLTKAEIREMLKERKIAVWNKPAFACLASRVPYGEPITGEKLKSIGGLEEELHQLGFAQVRVRHHGNLARIEVLPSQRQSFANPELMDTVNALAKKWGFTYCALDLAGYRMGSMNETLK